MTRFRHQIVYSKLAAVVGELGETFVRLSRSRLISERRAFAVALLDAEGRLAVQAQGEPVHLFALRATVRGMLDDFAFDVADGDVIAATDPYAGGTTGTTLTLAAPLFFDGELRFTAAVRFSAVDLGGEQPGLLQPAAIDLWQETLRVTPVKLRRAGTPADDVREFLLRNSRAPGLLAADLEAALVVHRQARQALAALIDAYGMTAVRAACRDAFDYAGRRVRGHLAVLEGRRGTGAATAESRLGESLRVEVAVEATPERCVLDFAGSSPTSAASVNLAPEATRAAALTALLAALLDELTPNEGLLESVQIALPADTLVNPEFPAPVSLGPMITAHLVAAAVTGAARSAGGGATRFPAVHGLEPLAMCFEPVGSIGSAPPQLLDPAFPVCAAGWGPPALRGVRRFVSAEELEAERRFRIEAREYADGRDIRVRIENIGEDLEAVVHDLGSALPGQRPPAVTLTDAAADAGSSGAPVRSLPRGAALEMHYPAVEEEGGG